MLGGIFKELQYRQPLAKLCTDEAFTYYSIAFHGYLLMYRQKTLRPDGRRFYYLTDSLAKAIGYIDLRDWQTNKINTRFDYKIRWWRRFVSVEALNKHFL